MKISHVSDRVSWDMTLIDTKYCTGENEINFTENWQKKVAFIHNF